MSLHEALQNLDEHRLRVAVTHVLGKMVLEPDSPKSIDEPVSQADKESIRTDVRSYTVLNSVPDLIDEGIKTIAPDDDADASIQHSQLMINGGASLVVGVLCEYAKLEQLGSQFPDIPTEPTV